MNVSEYRNHLQRRIDEEDLAFEVKKQREIENSKLERISRLRSKINECIAFTELLSDINSPFREERIEFDYLGDVFLVFSRCDKNKLFRIDSTDYELTIKQYIGQNFVFRIPGPECNVSSDRIKLYILNATE